MAASSTGKLVLVIVAVVVTMICFVTGLFIGWFLLDAPSLGGDDDDMMTPNYTKTSSSSRGPSVGASRGGGQRPLLTTWLREADPTISAKLIQEIQGKNIEQHIRVLSERPHLAGTEGDQRTVDYVKQEFQAMGYDVTLSPYDVLLSYPADEYFNKVSMLDGRRRNPIFTTGTDAASGRNSEITWPYCMYSPSGKVQGKLIYANYGRPQDFKLLDRLGVSPDEAVIIMRYGKISRSRKVREATKRGAAAVVLYNDPADSNLNMTYNVYPATWWLPGDDVEHGNTRSSWGDPATPGHAATEGAYRIPGNQMDLPVILCHPVGYKDARVLLQNLEGERAPEDWQGLLGFVYHVGTNTPGALPVEVDVKNTLETRRVYNIFAILPGALEKDRVVLVGNHRDAIAYGAVDPGSGTAVMLEVARAFMTLYKQGWQPRRTIMFCSWAAEEFGLIGSTEWVEEKRQWLSDHAVAYLNVNTVLQGNYTFDMSATPSLKAAGIRAASRVPDPHNKTMTVLDVWRQRVLDDRSPGLPWIRRPVSFTDIQPFVHLLGIPVTHSRYSFVEQDGVLIYPIRNYPLHHTAYDTMHLATMMDPNFAVSAAVAAIVAELTRDIADSLFLPLKSQDYAVDIMTHLQTSLEKATSKFNTSVYYLQAAMHEFYEAAENLQRQIDNFDFSDPYEARRLNDKLMLFEREFVDHRTGEHLFLKHGSNAQPTLDRQTLSILLQSVRAAVARLAS